MPKSYYYLEYEVHSHYEDSVVLILLDQQNLPAVLNGVLDEYRLMECLVGAATLTLSRIEQDDLMGYSTVAEIRSLLPFMELLISNIAFSYWYEDDMGEEQEASFPSELYVTFDPHQKAVFWSKDKTPLVLEGLIHPTTGVQPFADDASSVQFVFEDFFTAETKYEWTRTPFFKPSIHQALSNLEGTPLAPQEESSCGLLHLIYENGSSTDQTIQSFLSS